jgi:1-acyl-sn-glycerol-3-phosphate acyltransferase
MPVASACDSGKRILPGAFYNARVILARLPAPLRRFIRISLLMLHLVWGMALATLAFPLFSTAQRDRAITAWARLLLRVLGIRLQADTPPTLPDGALLVCNHVSWLDLYLIHAARRVHFVSKAEVRGWPVAGWLAHKTGTLFIERGRRADTARINSEMRALLQSGSWLAVFPEGTTSDGRGLRRFMPSLLQPAVELNCPIVPAALRYRTLDHAYSAVPAYIGDISMWQSLKRIVSEPGLIAELHFAAPIVPNGHRRELAAQAEAATARLLGVAPADTSPQTPADLPA